MNEMKEKDACMKRNEMSAEEIMRLAEESGVDDNFFFMTTFDRYQTQLKILDGLKQAIEGEGMLVSKEYVKGRKNVYANPAVAEYNRTTDSANKTVSTLMKIIKTFGSDGRDDGDNLLEMISGE